MMMPMMMLMMMKTNDLFWLKSHEALLKQRTMTKTREVHVPSQGQWKPHWQPHCEHEHEHVVAQLHHYSMTMTMTKPLL
jgi:hypothetical protein